MSLVLIEALTFARRLARRRVVVTTLALCAAATGWCVVFPVGSARGALDAAHGLGLLATLVLAAGCIGDDRAAGRLLLAATHPAPRSAWIVGRWLAVAAGAAAVTLPAAVAIALAGPGLGRPALFGLGLAAAAVHLAAFAALAVLLSAVAGVTEQVLALLALLVVGLIPPDVLAGLLGAPWHEPATRVAWTALPTPWALDRAQAWVLGRGDPQVVQALALVAQAPLALALGARALARAELGARAL